MESTLKRTPLHAWHGAHGANIADFGGYEMPLWYSSAKAEHLSVLSAAGMFDTSHMAVVLVNGDLPFYAVSISSLAFVLKSTQGLATAQTYDFFAATFRPNGC